MTKVVRAFSLDESVSEEIDYYTQIPGVAKPMNKSRYVNDALKFYMNRNIPALMDDYRSALAAVQRANQELDKIVASQGVKHHLGGLLRCLFPFLWRKRVKQPKQ
jgi:hypothetical protein